MRELTIVPPKELIRDEIIENEYANGIFREKYSLRVILINAKHSLFLISSFLDLARK